MFKSNVFKTFILPAILGLLSGVIICLLLFKTFVIPTASMEPTIPTGSRVIVLTTPLASINNGDIAVIKDSNHWTNEDYLLKRIIATENQTVEGLSDGTILIDGNQLDEPYLPTLSPQESFKATVPPGHVWLMGDNRGNSADSRVFEGDKRFVPVSSVQGILIYSFPPSS